MNGYLLKLAALLLTLALLLSLVCCGGKPAGTDNVTGAAGSDNITDTAGAEQVTDTQPLLSKIGIKDMTIIRPEYGNDSEIDAAVRIHTAMRELSGVYFSIREDWVKPGTEHDPEKYEILVGNTNYAESAEAAALIEDNEYSVSVIGHKIVIVCGALDERTIVTAADAFIAILGEYISGGDFLFGSDISLRGKTAGVLGADRLSYTLAVGGNNTTVNTKSTQKVYGNCTAALYKAHIEGLVSAGSRVLAENVIGANLYTTLEDAGQTRLTTIYYIDTLGLIREISEPWHTVITELPAAQTQKTCDTTLMQLECTDGAAQSDVFRLEDGRYVIYDTGTENAAPLLMEYMRENNIYTDGKIHIAAIFVSHPHVDHMDGLVALAAKYRGELVVETVYANLIAASIQSVYSSSTLEERLQKIISAAKSLGATFVYARTGQKLTVSNGVFEVLFTPEDLGEFKLDGSDTSHDMNNACMVVRATLKGQTIILVGDSRGGQTPIFTEMYKKALACDIMSVTHHGYNIVEALVLYKTARPAVLLWPNNYYETDRSFVKQLLAASYIKEHILADVRHVLTLPYTPK